MRPFMLLLVALVCAAGALPAQDASCSYDRCALRLKTGTWSTSIVQGAAETPVGSVSLFAPSVPLLAQSRDSMVRQLFASYQQRSRLGTALGVGATGLFIASFFAWDSDPSSQGDEAAIGMLLGSAVLAIPALLLGRSASNQLQKSVWHFNSAFAR